MDNAAVSSVHEIICCGIDDDDDDDNNVVIVNDYRQHILYTLAKLKSVAFERKLNSNEMMGKQRFSIILDSIACMNTEIDVCKVSRIFSPCDIFYIFW